MNGAYCSFISYLNTSLTLSKISRQSISIGNFKFGKLRLSNPRITFRVFCKILFQVHDYNTDGKNAEYKYRFFFSALIICKNYWILIQTFKHKPKMNLWNAVLLCEQTNYNLKGGRIVSQIYVLKNWRLNTLRKRLIML